MGSRGGPDEAGAAATERSRPAPPPPVPAPAATAPPPVTRLHRARTSILVPDPARWAPVAVQRAALRPEAAAAATLMAQPQCQVQMQTCGGCRARFQWACWPSLLASHVMVKQNENRKDGRHRSPAGPSNRSPDHPAENPRHTPSSKLGSCGSLLPSRPAQSARHHRTTLGQPAEPC